MTVQILHLSEVSSVSKLFNVLCLDYAFVNLVNSEFNVEVRILVFVIASSSEYGKSRTFSVIILYTSCRAPCVMIILCKVKYGYFH